MEERTTQVRCSESIAELAKALAKAQAAMKPVPKDSENPFFKSKYADLAAVWENCRKPLTENGLAVIQIPENEGEEVVITTILAHESGEWISGKLRLPPTKTDPQGVGSAITYGRRYALAAMVGVCAEDEDDDAEGAVEHGKETQQAPTKAQNGLISKAQAKRMFALAKGNVNLVKAVLKNYGYEKSEQIKKTDYEKICQEIEAAVKGENSQDGINEGEIPSAILKMAQKAGMTEEDLINYIQEKFGKGWNSLSGEEKSEVTKHLHDLGQEEQAG